MRPAGSPRFDGWRMVAFGALAQGLALPLIGAYGLVLTPLTQEFGASEAQLGAGLSLAILAPALAGPPLGLALDRGPLRTIMLAGVALMLGSVLVLSRAETLAQLALGFGFATVGMSMYGMLPVQVMLVNWFVLRRGSALSIAWVGTSIAAFVVPPATAWLIEWLGWRNALVALAAGAAACAVPVIARLVKRPEEVGQTPDGIPADPPPSARERASSDDPPARGLRDWLRDPNFWLIGVGVGLALCVSLSGVFLVRHLETLGIPRTRAALVPSLMALFGIAGKLGVGWLVDRFDARAVAAGALALHALGWVVVATGASLGSALVAAAPLGLGGGGFLPLPPVFQGRCFGRDAIGRVGGLHALVHLPFLLVAAPLVGWAVGRSGSFAAPFLGLAGVLAAAGLALAAVRPPAASREPSGRAYGSTPPNS